MWPADAIGISLKTDRTTMKGEFGHFVRVLIDVDFSSKLSTSLSI